MLSKIIFSGIYGIGGIVDKLFAERREITPILPLCVSTGGPPLLCIDECQFSAKERPSADEKCLVGLADYVCKFHWCFLVDKLSSVWGTERPRDFLMREERRV